MGQLTFDTFNGKPASSPTPKPPIDTSNLAPMMKYCLGLKSQYPEHLILIQVGDFYEIFFDDAPLAADALGIRLTSRNKGSENAIPMCGVPIHAIDTYLPKLLTKGFSCVIVSQVDEAKGKKGASTGAVRREITRIITPGVRYEGDGLDEKKFNYLAACTLSSRDTGAIAYIDVSTGNLRIAEVETLEGMLEMLDRIMPVELILPSTLFGMSTSQGQTWLREIRKRAEDLSCHLVKRPFDVATHSNISERIKSLLSLESLPSSVEQGCRGLSREACSVLDSVLNYVAEVSFGPAQSISQFVVEEPSRVAFIDAATRRNLELFETRLDGNRKNSLVDVIDCTKTAMGSRLLSEWLSAPSCDRGEIESRYETVEEFSKKYEEREQFRLFLSSVRDVDRLLSRVITLRASPRDLRVLADSIAQFPKIKQLVSSFSSEIINKFCTVFDALEDVHTKLDDALLEEPSVKVNEGSIIKSGYNSNVDELRRVSGEGRQWLVNLEARERKNTGISGLKVKYNNVFGYFIEVSKVNASKVPDSYERKQTLVNAERYVTEELKELEVSVLSARARQVELEKELFVDLRKWVSGVASRIQASSRWLSGLDVLAAFGELAISKNYCRPSLVSADTLCIRAGRHPVIEEVIGQHNFVPNDCNLGRNGKVFAVLTGPNMGGKSTFLRQVGLIQLLAQVGSFVPAGSAELGLVDRIFTRIGTADDITRGDSTFMVEMREATTIIKKATSRSLVLIDEIGRGTATTDGLAIATSIAEWLHDCIGCKTIFATHFHELTELADYKAAAFCISVGIIENAKEITFTHRIEQGAADRSYGLEVARLAGLPEALMQKAERLMERLVAHKIQGESLKGPIVVEKQKVLPEESKSPQYSPAVSGLIEKVRAFNINTLTPLEALGELSKLQECLGDGD